MVGGGGRPSPSPAVMTVYPTFESDKVLPHTQSPPTPPEPREEPERLWCPPLQPQGTVPKGFTPRIRGRVGNDLTGSHKATTTDLICPIADLQNWNAPTTEDQETDLCRRK